MKTKNVIWFCLLIVIGLVLMLTNECKKDKKGGNEIQFGFVTDIDKNSYKTIKIGTQEWMKENLKTTKFIDSTSIPLVTDSTVWRKLTTPAYCWYNNDEATNKATYGALYNWYAVNNNMLCPAGWHMSSESEWLELVDYVGGDWAK